MPKTKKKQEPRNPAGINQYIKGTAKKTKAEKMIGLRLEIELDQKIREIPNYTKVLERWIEEGFAREYESEYKPE